jgi:hypothetical protein
VEKLEKFLGIMRGDNGLSLSLFLIRCHFALDKTRLGSWFIMLSLYDQTLHSAQIIIIVVHGGGFGMESVLVIVINLLDFLSSVAYRTQASVHAGYLNGSSLLCLVPKLLRGDETTCS